MILPTWDQTLRAPFHVHCIVAAGALSANGARWIGADPRFLLPVRALSTVLRGKFCEALAQRGSTGAMPLVESPLALGTPEDFAQLRAQLYTKEWVVYAKAPLAGPAHVLDYVGRYTHRVAIANHRILDVRDGWVRTNRHKARTLRRCRELLGQPAEPPPRRSKSVVQWMQEVTGIDLTQCPHCGTRPLVRLPLPPLSTPAASRETPLEVPIHDSSCALAVCPGSLSTYRHGSPGALRGTCVSTGV